MKLAELLDKDKLKDHLLMRVVSEMRHPQYKELAIYNYTHVAQHDNIWDDVTTLTRGLIVNTETDEVLARPFRKFFNLNTSFRPETLEQNLPAVAPTILEKLDGSLGILFHYGGLPHIATRGSFTSDQAVWATNWYRNKFATDSPAQRDLAKWPGGYTALFEIIYHENRIVVSYDFEALVLLGFVGIESGIEISPAEVHGYADLNGLRSPKLYDYMPLDTLKKYVGSNEEGFVLQFWQGSTPLRVKVKTEDYCRLHKIITSLNPKGIWEHLMAGKPQEDLWWEASHNGEFTAWCIGWIQNFQKLYDKIEREAISALGRVAIIALHESSKAEPKLDERATRKAWAMAIQQEPAHLHSVLFACLSGQDYKVAIWKLLEPKIQGKDAYIRNADEFNGL